MADLAAAISMADVPHRSLLCYDGSDPARAAIAAAGRIVESPALVVSVWEPVPPLDRTTPSMHT